MGDTLEPRPFVFCRCGWEGIDRERCPECGRRLSTLGVVV